MTAVLGAVHAVLLLLSYWLLSRVPEPQASDCESVSFYGSGDRQTDGARQFGNVLLFVFAMRMAAIFVITTANIGRTTGILPRWFVWAEFVVRMFLLLSVLFYPALVLVFPIWLMALSVLLLVRARRAPLATWSGSDGPQVTG